jgi:hypothetical protein
LKLDIRTLSASLVAGFVSWYLCAGIYNKNADSMWTPLLVALFFLVLAAITCLVVRLTTGRRTRFMQFKGIGQIMTMLAVGLVALMTLIYGNCPELFQIDGNATYYYNSVDRDGEKMVTGISELSYHMDEDTYRRAYQQCDRIVQEVVSGAAGLSAREAELHAYRYVTGHCVYDLSTPYCGTPYGALVEGRAKCDGTGKTMQWILEQMGIVCLSISGAPLDGGNGHQWNVAEIDGIFYDLDATADLGNQGDKLLYGRFNVDNHLIRDLYPIGDGYLSCFTIPGTDSMSGSYHARNHTRVESDADCGPILAQQFSQVIQKNGGSFAIQLAQSAQVDELSRIFGKWEDAERFLKEYGVSLQGFGYYSLTQPETNVYQFTVYRDS